MQASPDFAAIVTASQGRGAVNIEGVSGAGKALLCAALLADPATTGLIVSYSDERAQQLADDITAFFGDGDHPDARRRCVLYPSIASALYDGVDPDRGAVAARLTVLERLTAGTPTIVVASIKALVHLTVPGSALVAARREITKGEELDLDNLTRALLDLGYDRVDLVDDVGQFSVRGGIVDISPPTSPQPVRLELFGFEVESIRHFDPITQRSLMHLDRIGVGPAGEILLTEEAIRRALPSIRSAFRREIDQLVDQEKAREAERLRDRMKEDLELLEQLRPAAGLAHYLPYIYSEPESPCDYFPPETLVIVDEPVRVQSAAEQFEEDVLHAYKTAVKLGSHLRLPDTACMPFAKFTARYFIGRRAGRPLARGAAVPAADGAGAAGAPPQATLYLSMLQRDVPWAPKAELIHFPTPPVDSFGGKFELLVEGLAEWQREKQSVLVCTNDPDQTVEVLGSRGLQGIEAVGGEIRLEPGRIIVGSLDLTSGFMLRPSRLIVLTGREIYGWRKLRKPEEATYRRGFTLTSLRELHEGDYVVHINHGIALYKGLAKQTVGGMERDYLVLEYADNDKLYVPVTQLDRVQKYIGAAGGAPAVTALKSGRWEQQKKKAKKSAQLLARELMKLYAAREGAQGHAFSPDSPWMAELEASFRYEETHDQWQAIQEVKHDLEKPVPMDRLVCGDVGFGKTEVAIRAAFKACLDGKQVAVLTPTTILAQQHHNTFRERMSRYPIEVSMLSRFRSKEEQHKTIHNVKEGGVDIVVGTHRLLMSDIQFKDLGLVIIDEEQRFGVKQKEKLKKLRESVDVLTLTATPIPRTLNMALSGIREISLINDPPEGRMPVRTFVRERDDALIAEAIRRELARGGQVFFVHNRVKQIGHIAAHVQHLVPEARVGVGHGQLDEEDLEQVMLAFYAEEFDVLVCTTIIENGLDVPNVNTIIVDDADKLGLAQLYQLRGRVGRSNRQAYCYLLYRYPERMTVEAEERLRAIEEFSELGSGFKVALRDLEIRGAGDILGAEQSGHMSAVGLDLYCQMLAESVKALKGETGRSSEGLPAIDIPIEAVIPAQYVPGENQRIAVYRRLAAVESAEELADFDKEIRDRFGEPPDPVANLVRIAGLKLKAADVGVADVSAAEGRINVRLSEDKRLTPRELRVIQGLYTPTPRQARAGVRSSLPRATFSQATISFGYDRSRPDEMLAALEDVFEKLTVRDPVAVRRAPLAP